MKRLISVMMAVLMMISTATVTFATEPENKEVLTFEEFSAAVEEALAERGTTAQVDYVEPGVELTQEYLDYIIEIIETAPQVAPVSQKTAEVITPRDVDLAERTYTYYETLTAAGIPGFCEVKLTLVAKLFPNTGDLYGVKSLSSRESSGLLADSWNETNQETTEDYTSNTVDAVVEGYVKWSIDKVFVTTEHTITHTFDI